MPALGVDVEQVRRAIEDIARSPGFARNERLSQFLTFLVERHLEGRDQELKESVIGVEVFGRKPDYNPKRDPVVRTEARRLRERLAQYYQAGVADGGLIIELPKGGYVPLVRRTQDQPVAVSLPRFGRWRWAAFAAVALVIVLAVAVVARSSRRRTGADSPAFELYTRARAFAAEPAVRGILTSIDLFRQAQAKDPLFAPAYAGIAAGLAAKSGFDAFHPAQRAAMLAEGWSAASKALQLDPRSADAYDGLAMLQAREAQWASAERSFQRAIELAPRDILWHNHYAMFLLLPLGRVEDAIRQLRAAEEIEPLSQQTHSLLAVALRAAGRFDDAFNHCQKGAPSDQARSSCWAEHMQRQGQNEEAVRILETVWKGHLMEPGAQVLGIAYAKAGRRDDAERIAELLPRLASKTQIFAALQDKDRTFESLSRMVPMGPARIGRDFLLSSNLAFLRGEPRLSELKRKVGLPE